jgi:multidrug efflux pump subunit AcrB
MNDLFTPRMKKRIWRALPTSQALLLHHSRKRVLGKLRRVPPWADLEAIAEIYRQAREVAEATGIEQHVDHVFALQGKTVSGLHVAQNLRIVSATVNLKKHNTLPMDPEAWEELAPKRRGPRRHAGPSYREMFPQSTVRRRRDGKMTECR